MATSTRRLAAVWFADIVGYTGLSSQDEKAALSLIECFQQISADTIGRHGGRLVHFVGDAVLAEFQSAEAAVRAALDLEEGYAETSRERGIPSQLRIGVHVGDVNTTPTGDLFGDGVNTASRLTEQVALPGQVVVSQDVWRNLKPRTEFSFSIVGPRRMRGLSADIWVYQANRNPLGTLTAAELRVPHAPNAGRIRAAFRNPGRLLASSQAVGGGPPLQGRRRLAAYVPAAVIAGVTTAIVLLYTIGVPGARLARAGSGASGIEYLAVLPFEYQAADRSHEYIAAAMADQLTTSLGSINGLRVLGRQSAQAYDGSSGSPVEFARQQGLDALVTGAVFQIGQDVRVTVQLLDGRTGDQIWAESYRGTGGEILALADSTVRSVGRAIGALTAQEARRIAESAPVDPDVLSAYWLGSFYMQDYTEEAMNQAIRAFDQAIALDPGFAPAHAARARALTLLVQQGFLPASEFYPLARAGLDRALALDPNDPEVLSHDALFRMRTGRNWSGVQEQFETALRLNPNSGEVWHEYSHFLEAIVDTASASWAARRYREVEPRTRGPWYHLANVHRNRREWSKVVAVADSGLAVFPSYLPLRVARAMALVRLGHTDEAIASLQGVLSVSRDPIAMGTLAVAYARTGERQRARALQLELRELGQWLWVAIIHGALGELDDAFAAAKQGVDANQGNISFLHVQTDWDPLRVDCRRWRELLEYAGFAADVIDRSRDLLGPPRELGTAC